VKCSIIIIKLVYWNRNIPGINYHYGLLFLNMCRGCC